MERGPDVQERKHEQCHPQRLIAKEIAIEPVQLDWRIDALLQKLLQEGVEN